MKNMQKYQVTFTSADDVKQDERHETHKLTKTNESRIKLTTSGTDEGDEELKAINKRLLRSRMLPIEKMTVFARFKYEKGRPALRVHIWDIFDYANLNTASINDMFESINDQLCDIYEEIDASGEIEEVSDDDSNS